MPALLTTSRPVEINDPHSTFLEFICTIFTALLDFLSPIYFQYTYYTCILYVGVLSPAHLSFRYPPPPPLVPYILFNCIEAHIECSMKAGLSAKSLICEGEKHIDDSVHMAWLPIFAVYISTFGSQKGLTCDRCLTFNGCGCHWRYLDFASPAEHGKAKLSSLQPDPKTSTLWHSITGVETGASLRFLWILGVA